MQIELDSAGRVCGAEIQTSLLEKSRTCAFFQQERNFHIFYMLCYCEHPDNPPMYSACSVPASHRSSRTVWRHRDVHGEECVPLSLTPG